MHFKSSSNGSSTVAVSVAETLTSPQLASALLFGILLCYYSVNINL